MFTWKGKLPETLCFLKKKAKKNITQKKYLCLNLKPHQISASGVRKVIFFPFVLFFYCYYPLFLVLGLRKKTRLKGTVHPKNYLMIYSPSRLTFLFKTNTIDLSVSPSPQTQASQWQSSISCMGSRTRTSLWFSAIEKHWKIRSSNQFGVFASKNFKWCAWGTCNTDYRYLKRVGNIIYYIFWIQTRQSKMSLSIQP